MVISTTKALDGGSVRLYGDSVRAPEQAAATNRRAARRGISVALLLTGVFALVSGFWSLFLPRASVLVMAHVAGGCAFGALSLVHVRFNRNALRLYLRDLGWSPAVLRLAFATAIVLIVLAPVLRLV